MSQGKEEAPTSRPHLYVGNLSARVTESMLHEIFSVAGQISSVKIVRDRSSYGAGAGAGVYGFVEYVDMSSAVDALDTLNSRTIFDQPIRVNWARHSHSHSQDGAELYHVFVGDLAPEVDEGMLEHALSRFSTLAHVRIINDSVSRKSKGYAFASFRSHQDAQQAITTMNGEWLGSRPLRLNWATTQNPKHFSPHPFPNPHPNPYSQQGGIASMPTPSSFEKVLSSTGPEMTTVYVGNLSPSTTPQDLQLLFSPFAHILHIRILAHRSYAFVKLDSHHTAATAVFTLSASPPRIHQRELRIRWAREPEHASVLPPYPHYTPFPHPHHYDHT